MPWGEPRELTRHAWKTDDGTPAALKVERITFKPLS